MERYSIYEGYMDVLQPKLTKFKNKCKKLGCDFSFNIIGEEFKEIVCPNQNKQTFKFVIVEVDGTAKLNDWEFVASVDHFKGGNVIRKAITNLEIPDKYRYGDSYCEHCNTKRSRKNTYIVHNIKTGEFKQVGKSCLKDFTKGMSIEQVTFMLSLRDLFEEAEDQVYSPSFSSNKFYFNTKEILKYGAETVRLFGYVKSKYEDGTENYESTKNRTLDFWRYESGNFLSKYDKEKVEKLKTETNFDPNSIEAQELMQNAIMWITEKEATNDFLHNLKVLVSEPYITYQNVGILLALYPAYLKEKRKEEKISKEKSQSQWIGNVGDRIEIFISNFDCLTSWANSYNGYDNVVTYLYKLIDLQGNVFLWKTQNFLENVSKIKGTIKGHEEYKGIKDTVLTRCKVIA